MIWFINGYLLQQGAKQNWDDGSTRESSLAPVGVALFSGEGTSECLAPFLLSLSLARSLALSPRAFFSPHTLLERSMGIPSLQSVRYQLPHEEGNCVNHT